MIKSYLLKLYDQGLRPDGRKLLDYRYLKVTPGYAKTAEGSAYVKFGDTELIVGVKVEISTPYPDSPDKGSIMVGAELLPMSNPKHEPGPPGIDAVELARVIDRGIRESGALDFKQLCITPSEKCWLLIIDIVTVNDGGGLFDAAALGTLAALKNMRFPAVKDGAIDYKTKTDKGVKLTSEPIAVTVFKTGKHFLIDPIQDEEELCDARLTVASTADGNLCAMQKGGNVPLTAGDIAKMVDIALEKAGQLRGALGG